MPMSISEMVREQLEEEENEDVLDFVSEGEDENFDDFEAPIKMDESFPTSVFICNVPKVAKEKYDKLLGVLGRLVDRYGANEKHMPINEETNMTTGFLIVTYETEEAAQTACKVLDGWNLDKTHTFKVVTVDRFDEITYRSEEFQAKQSVSCFSRTDFRDWLCDNNCREQFLLRYQTETEIYWHDTMQGTPVLCYGGEREKRQKKIWCDWRVQWSPQGSYLATFHQQGIALWAGPDFTKKVRFAHEAVKHIDFSPNEEFVLTWNGTHSSEQDENAVRIFRVLTGECMRKQKTPTVTPLGGEFPHFLWSNDGKFFAECTESSIIVRDTDTFDRIKDEEGLKKGLKFENLLTFSWSPRDNVLAVWTAESEKGNTPARLVLVEIPSRRELASRSRTQCEATTHWQSEGDYFCLMVTKLSKTKKKGQTNLEIFRLRERNIPVDIVEIKDTVRSFHWETKGNRFAILTTDEAGQKPKVCFFALQKDKCENVCTFDLPSNSFDNVFWAPDGQYFLCAAMNAGDLLFGGLSPDNKLEILHKDEHFMLTDVQWDPSSRYVITAVAQPMRDDMGGFKYQMEAGFSIWTFQGRNLFKQQKEKLWQVSWRPRPPLLLTDEKATSIRKNIKQYSKKYDAIDDQAKEQARSAFKQERDAKTAKFRSVLNRLEGFKEEKHEENGWDEAWSTYLGEQGWEKVDDKVEDELDTTEDLIS